jgi:predicted amidophosphoribosyltransferase
MGSGIGEGSVTGSCPECGRAVQANARFCRGCGHALAEQRDEPHAEPPAHAGAPSMSSSSESPDAASPSLATTVVSPQTRAAGSPEHPGGGRMCEACGAEAGDRARFCRACGAPLGHTGIRHTATPAPTCPRCQKEVERWAAFCRHCGERLTGPVDVRAAAGEARSACVVCGAESQRPGGLCAGCAEALPG